MGTSRDLARYTIGVDIGGTFTDVVLMSRGEVRTSKAPTTPRDFSIGVLDALRQAAADLETTLPDLLARTDLLNQAARPQDDREGNTV